MFWTGRERGLMLSSGPLNADVGVVLPHLGSYELKDIASNNCYFALSHYCVHTWFSFHSSLGNAFKHFGQILYTVPVQANVYIRSWNS